MPRCQSKQCFMRGITPTPHQKIQCGVCTRRCIFCDIWKLATLIYTHVSLSSRYSTTPEQLQRMSSNQSHDYRRSEKTIQAKMMTERSRIASIMSICTIEGAEQTEGLHVAYRRCFKAVQELLYQEAILEDDLDRTPTLEYESFSNHTSRRQSHSHYYPEQRRPSMVSMAA